MRRVYSEINENQTKINNLVKLIKTIINNEGAFKSENNTETHKLVLEAKKIGVDTPKEEGEFSIAEKELFLENIRMYIDDLNTINDLKIQTATRLTHI